jgi:hypothetical protein
MVVQSTNTGGDLGENHFDLQMPGGGVGIFDGCTPEYGGLKGAQYGGVSSRSDCDSYPSLLKDGCYWRFDWFANADNPDFTFEQVQCPKALTDISGCKRTDDSQFPAFKGDTSAGTKVTTTKAVSAAATKPATTKSSTTTKAAVKPVTTTTKKTTTTKAAAATKTTAATGSSCVALYGQCGGTKEAFPKGNVCCASGSKCVTQNPYYAQCLPN